MGDRALFSRRCGGRSERAMRNLTESKVAMPLNRYLVYRYGRVYGSRKAFAIDMNVTENMVRYWLRNGWVVVGNRLYSPRRRVK